MHILLAHSDLFWCLSEQWHSIVLCKKCMLSCLRALELAADGAFSYLAFLQVILGQRMSSRKVLRSSFKVQLLESTVRCVHLGNLYVPGLETFKIWYCFFLSGVDFTYPEHSTFKQVHRIIPAVSCLSVKYRLELVAFKLPQLCNFFPMAPSL